MTPRLFRAPGRVNLIGEHTDYNDGFVLPAAIPFHTTVRATQRDDQQLQLSSRQLPGEFIFLLDDPSIKPQNHWTDYVVGVALQLIARDIPLRGVTLEIDSTIPVGAGLSSSAALEISSALALLALCGKEMSKLELAECCRVAESEFVGIRCGIMDQFISLHGETDHAVLLDCRSLEHRAVPIPPHVRLVIANTMVKHELAGSEYNERRQDCETAALVMEVPSLRDATRDQLEAAEMVDTVRRRALHVIEEIERTERAADALLAGDAEGFGCFMYESHESLRTLYEVSCPELDTMVAIARELPGVFGARMTGGGFGGCTINLVEASAADAFRAALQVKYREATGITPDVFLCTAAEGAKELTE